MVSRWLLTVAVLLANATTALSIRILAIIAAMKSKHNEYLTLDLARYRDSCEAGYDVTVLVQTSEGWDPASEVAPLLRSLPCSRDSTGFHVQFEAFDPSVGIRLTQMHRGVVAKNVNHFDLFIYQEDDIGIKSTHIHNFLVETAALERSALADVASQEKTSPNTSPNLPVIGFLRYEILTTATTFTSGELRVQHDEVNGGRFLVENPLTQFSLRCINNQPYFVDWANPHQAMWMLTREQVKRLDRQCGFLHQQDTELLEERGKMVYMSSFSLFKADPRVLQGVGIQQGISCDVEKVIPAQDFLQYGVHHMRQRYAEATPIMTIGDMLIATADFVRRSPEEVPSCWHDAIRDGLLVQS